MSPSVRRLKDTDTGARRYGVTHNGVTLLMGLEGLRQLYIDATIELANAETDFRTIAQEVVREVFDQDKP